MECKGRILAKLAARYTVLIETLWNVKVYKGERTSMWRLSFNRNIVECKDEYMRMQEIRLAQVLIETLWNVK